MLWGLLDFVISWSTEHEIRDCRIVVCFFLSFPPIFSASKRMLGGFLLGSWNFRLIWVLSKWFLGVPWKGSCSNAIIIVE